MAKKHFPLEIFGEIGKILLSIIEKQKTHFNQKFSTFLWELTWQNQTIVWSPLIMIMKIE